MPLEKNKSFKRPFLFFNRHVETIIPGIFRSASKIPFIRERINTPDQDFLDIDWHQTGHERLVILSHGLEGNSRRAYMTGMAKVFSAGGFDVLAWNCRGCSGEDNLKVFAYTSGKTEDLYCVIAHALETKNYTEIQLVGFSMGGNIVLKYLGENKFPVPVQIKKAMAFSPPCDLGSGSDQLNKGFNKIYQKRFVGNFKHKMLVKSQRFPDEIPIALLSKIKTVRDFDEYFTAPLNGFKNARDYYEQNSSKQFISRIAVPTYILSAANDPFLGAACYPTEECAQNNNVLLHITKYGGHLGFRTNRGNYYDEEMARQFCRK